MHLYAHGSIEYCANSKILQNVAEYRSILIPLTVAKRGLKGLSPKNNKPFS